MMSLFAKTAGVNKVATVGLQKGDVIEVFVTIGGVEEGPVLLALTETVENNESRGVFCGAKQKNTRDEIKEKCQYLRLRFLTGPAAVDDIIGITTWKKIGTAVNPCLDDLDWMPGKSKGKVVEALTRMRSLCGMSATPVDIWPGFPSLF